MTNKSLKGLFGLSLVLTLIFACLFNKYLTDTYLILTMIFLSIMVVIAPIAFSYEEKGEIDNSETPYLD